MKYFAVFSLILLFVGCSNKSLDENKTVEQKIWHDDYHEETVVKTKDDNSSVVSTVSTRKQTINMKEMDKLTQDRVDKELQRRKKEEMEFDDSIDSTVKVFNGVGKVLGTVLGTAAAAALEAKK